MSQMQLIRSLGEAMAWFEREISWGVPPTELRHLCGRIGELYVAMITNGQMATELNQRGYDVVSAINERISVKTTAQSGLDGFVSFTAKDARQVEREWRAVHGLWPASGLYQTLRPDRAFSSNDDHAFAASRAFGLGVR